MAKGKGRTRRELDDDFFSLAAFDDSFDELPHRWEGVSDDLGRVENPPASHRLDAHGYLDGEGGCPSCGLPVVDAEAEGALQSAPLPGADLSLEANAPLAPVSPDAVEPIAGPGLPDDVGDFVGVEAGPNAWKLTKGADGALESHAPNDEVFLEGERVWESSDRRVERVAEDREHIEARRVRRRFLVVDLLLGLAIAAVFASVAFVAKGNQPQPPVEPFPNPDDLFACCSRVPIATVPNLISLEGDTSEEVLTTLGPNASLISASVGESEAGAVRQPVKIEREVFIRFAPEERTSRADYSSAKLHLTQDGSGRTRDISYEVSLDDLGYQNLSFASALSDVGFWRSTLGSAGIPGHDITLDQPDSITDTHTMGTNALGAEYVAKESHTFSGTYGSTALFAWSLELLYDHTPEAASFRSGDTTRTMIIRIAPHEQD